MNWFPNFLPTPLFIQKFQPISSFPLPQNQGSYYFFANHEFHSTDHSIFQLHAELTASWRGELWSQKSALLIMDDDATEKKRRGWKKKVMWEWAYLAGK